MSNFAITEIDGEWELTFGPQERSELERMVIVGTWDDLEDFALLSALKKDHFRDWAARDGWYAMLECARKYQRVDRFLVRETMLAKGEGKSFDALNLVMEAHTVITVSAIRSAALLITEMEFRRKAWTAAQEILKDVQRRALTLDELRVRSTTSLTEAFIGSDSKIAREAKQVLIEQGDEMAGRESDEERAEQTGERLPPINIPTPFANLNDLTSGGPTTGQVIYIGGWPGSGKSALATDIGLFMAETLDCPGAVYYWSGEMSEAQIARRIASKKTGVKIGNVKATHLYQAAGEVPGFWIDDDSDTNIDILESRLRLFKAMFPGFKVLILDYILLMSELDHKQLAILSKRLVKLAKVLGILILGLQQLKTELEQRQDKRPKQSDLAECGQFQRDAGGIWMVHRPAVWIEGYKNQKEAYVFVRKNRDGPLGQVSLEWIPETATYRQYIPVKHPAPELREPEPELPFEPEANFPTVNAPDFHEIPLDNIPEF